MQDIEREALRLLGGPVGPDTDVGYRTLVEYLRTFEAKGSRGVLPFRMPVRSVGDAGRSIAGTVASGSVNPGDAVAVLPSGQLSKVQQIAGAGGNLPEAQAEADVVLMLADALRVEPGDILAAPQERPQVADQFEARLVWLSPTRLLPGRAYLMKINHVTVAATVTALKHRVEIVTGARLAARTLGLGEVGVCNLSLVRPVAFDAYADNRQTGAFALIDRYSNEPMAVGMIDFALRRATNIHHQAQTVSKSARLSLMRHRPAVLWFTGLPAAGKSTIANLVDAALNARGIHTTMLDGDNVRHGLNRDLGFTEADRVENIRRVGEVAKLMADAGLVVLCSFISPFRAERRMVRELVGDQEFIEVFVDTPIETCIARDPKGLYRRALAGEIKNFTGIDQTYEAPENPELHLLAGSKDANHLANEVVDALVRRKIV